MRRLPTFDLLRPTTVDEAVAMLADHPQATIVGGGTDLLPNMKRRQVRPATLVSLSQIPGLVGISVEDGGAVRIGASTLLADLAQSTTVPPVLAAAAAEVASPQIRNVATVGGNLCIDTRCSYINATEEWRAASGSCLKDSGDTCWVAPRGGACVAVSSSDLAPVMVALDAVVHLMGPQGEREVPAEQLYRRDGLVPLTLAPGEVLTGVVVPPMEGRRASYRKLRRRGAIDFPILGVAASVRMGSDGKVVEARIVFGAVASAPFRVPAAENLLVGRALDRDVIDEAAGLAASAVKTYDNADLGSRYRKWMAEVFVRRALEGIC